MFLLMFVCSQRGGGLSLEGSVPRPKSEKWAVRILLECFLLGYSVDVKVKFPFRPSVSPTVIYSGFRRNSKWPYKASSTTVKHASGADQELPVLNNSGTFTLRSLHWATTSVSSSWRLMTWLILGGPLYLVMFLRSPLAYGQKIGAHKRAVLMNAYQQQW